MKKAIVTMAVGEAYVQAFETHARPNWVRYADRHGYDLFVLTEPIDTRSQRSIHWQKLLVGMLPEIKAYDVVVWLDADVIINARTAPCVVSQVTSDRIAVADPPERVSAAETVSERFLTFAIKFNTEIEGGVPAPLHVRKPRAELAYRPPGDLRAIERSINTGLIVFRPALHNAFLAKCYAKGHPDAADGSFEQTPISYELQAADMAEYIDGRFNATWAEYAAVHYPFLYDYAFINANQDLARKCVNVFYHNNYFCHFAGAGRHSITKTMLELVDQDAPHVMAALAPDFWARRGEVYADVEEE